MADVLPDSRLASAVGEVMADWPITDEFGNRKVIRLCLQPIFCFNCGKPNGYVPVGIMAWVSWLCPPCAEKWSPEASALMAPDDEFWRAVAEEMQTRFGHVLSQAELERLAEQGRLGSALEKLDRESPYRA